MKPWISGLLGGSPKTLFRRNRLNHWLEGRHPNLLIYGYDVTSRRNKKYNCVAFAADDYTRWWEPLSGPGFFWPKRTVPMDYAIQNYVRVFELMGYRRCDTEDFVSGFEKVAIYQDESGEFTHIARQTRAGDWQSKMGPYEDIRHDVTAALNDEVYGAPTIFLERRITAWRKIKKAFKSIRNRPET